MPIWWGKVLYERLTVEGMTELEIHRFAMPNKGAQDTH